MSDTTSPPNCTFTITILSLAAGASAPTTNTWQVTGNFAEAHGDNLTITDLVGNVVAIAPVGSIIIRDDALVLTA
jgi:hypothetical protein